MSLEVEELLGEKKVMWIRPWSLKMLRERIVCPAVSPPAWSTGHCTQSMVWRHSGIKTGARLQMATPDNWDRLFGVRRGIRWHWQHSLVLLWALPMGTNHGVWRSVGIKEVREILSLLMRNNDELPSSFGHSIEVIFGILYPLRTESERVDQHVTIEDLWPPGNTSEMRGKRLAFRLP